MQKTKPRECRTITKENGMSKIIQIVPMGEDCIACLCEDGTVHHSMKKMEYTIQVEDGVRAQETYWVKFNEVNSRLQVESPS